jgi:hypothetical protein
VVAAQYAISASFLLIFWRYADSKPLLGWGAAVAGFVAYFALYAVMIWKAEFIVHDD